MADYLPDSAQESLSVTEDEDLSTEETQTHLRKGRAPPQRLQGLPLATKSDINNMVLELKAFFTSELAELKGELSTFTATCTQLSMGLGHLEGSARQRNVKVREIPDTVDAAEFPQFILRLFSSTLTPRQAKGLSLDGLYRIIGRSRNQATAT
ncbi:Hypothetical predicted protein [Pelobates cultripes]|uniref:Uncharacterized protein n=1 Tax=Pelobates cultripes TaxID=61616 RepID=A0AAD1W244_PELCU|nr:Hypothetical predicted protein [Pelobates cultripes]